MKIGRKFGWWVGGCVVGLAAVLGALAFLFFHTFYPSARKADYPQAHDLTTAQRQDLDYFQHYFTLNRAYSPEALTQAKGLYHEAQANAGTYSAAAFDLLIMRMAALSDNGHSKVFTGPLSRRNNRIPCRLYRFADGYYVIRAQPACEALLGAKLLAVDGMPVDDLVDRMYAYTLGPRNHYDQSVTPFFLESPDLLHAAGLAGEANRLSLRVQLPDGNEHDVMMFADPPDATAPRLFSDSYLSPRRIDGESADWAPLLPSNAALPQFLRDYDTPFHTDWWPEKSTYYVQFRSNKDEPGHPIRPFIERVEREVAAHSPRFIVLDLRLDQGGDFTTTASLMKRIATLTDSIQHVYVLTSAWTFSAGNISLALVKEHGGDKVSVLGDPVGDRVRIWAEGGDLQLPNSKLRIGYATGYHDYSKPCWGERGCFWVVLFFPTHVTSFDPDVRVPFTFEDYVHLRDPVLEKAFVLAGKLDQVDSTKDKPNALHQ
ncbi:MAG: hypothetical protein ABIY56_02630 [Dokdonella sp.]